MSERMERDDRETIEKLLPWFATGRLSQAEADRVEAALARDPHLRLSLSTIAEDMSVVAQANAEAPVPTRRARDRLARMIEESAPRRSRGVLNGALLRLRSALTPRMWAAAGVAALLLIFVQAALVADLLIERPHGATYQTASAPPGVGGATLLVRFSANAKLADIASFLDRRGMAIVDGPMPGGFWTIRVGPSEMPRARLDAAIASLRAQPDLVAIVLPGARS